MIFSQKRRESLHKLLLNVCSKKLMWFWTKILLAYFVSKNCSRIEKKSALTSRYQTPKNNNNRTECTHDVLARNKIVVRIRVRGTFGKTSPYRMSRFSSKEKKGKKVFFFFFLFIASIGCADKRSQSNLLLTRLCKKIGEVESFWSSPPSVVMSQ